MDGSMLSLVVLAIVAQDIAKSFGKCTFISSD